MSTTIATERTGNARLLKLAALLKRLPRKRFDYRYWIGNDWKGAPDLSCGTTACALGWATTIPSLRRAGLFLNKDLACVSLTGVTNYDSFKAAQYVFGIESWEATGLFSPEASEYNATPKQVARKIETFVANRQKASSALRNEKEK